MKKISYILVAACCFVGCMNGRGSLSEQRVAEYLAAVDSMALDSCSCVCDDFDEWGVDFPESMPALVRLDFLWDMEWDSTCVPEDVQKAEDTVFLRFLRANGMVDGTDLLTQYDQELHLVKERLWPYDYHWTNMGMLASCYTQNKIMRVLMRRYDNLVGDACREAGADLRLHDEYEVFAQLRMYESEFVMTGGSALWGSSCWMNGNDVTKTFIERWGQYQRECYHVFVEGIGIEPCPEISDTNIVRQIDKGKKWMLGQCDEYLLPFREEAYEDSKVHCCEMAQEMKDCFREWMALRAEVSASLKGSQKVHYDCMTAQWRQWYLEEVTLMDEHIL